MVDDPTAGETEARGREAARPRQMPMRGWRDALFRVKDQIGERALSLVAAGVAFYSFLSLFPALVALLSIYGLIASPRHVAGQMNQLQGAVPASALHLVQSQIAQLTRTDHATLGISLVVSVLIALYSASKGAGAMISALNIAYGEIEKRGFFKLQGITLLLTFSGIVFFILMLGAIGLTAYLNQIALPGWLTIIIRVVRWLIVLAMMTAALAVLLAWAPSRRRPKFQWVTPGAVFATVLWLLASIAFSFYIGHFGSYNKTYGSAAAIVILMTWFWLSAFFVLVGAGINGELERQTRRDSTKGSPRPLGERDAAAADEVSPSP
ncbi:YihY/virulence factor BrkB family protein [Salinisphaera sp.]|uniref:YihY/virulence factor BrkB family protein n=1 Tax=Salinisphaera sp. TaxID=1914330 RepID=UPI002D79D218|nr:YihY/virulence factor BrkB family protein [Salinisphaera sp.]HET7314392.1 YihY/virulence factor BrkB family protein [Salinisphaera sp.]